MFKNFKAGKLEETDKKFMRLADNFLGLTDHEEGHAYAEMRWYIMTRLQGKPVSCGKFYEFSVQFMEISYSLLFKFDGFDPERVAAYMRGVFEIGSNQSHPAHPGFKMNKRFKTHMKNFVRKEFEKRDLRVHVKKPDGKWI